MTYVVVADGLVSNLVEAEPEIAKELGTVPYYDGCTIGQPYDPPAAYTELERAQQAITDLELSDIEQGQAITDLELIILEVRNV